ncbi:hypothetical protein Zmor_008815 [Zophobas morio]|uniref:60S ribosomal protein L36 n=1 Tax=Zophobas morio TaxID=2755281 RepID=A0AA38HM76_9CUCU|nr:hypothetical protein Zmor_008815 [Zophobas morio]
MPKAVYQHSLCRGLNKGHKVQKREVYYLLFFFRTLFVIQFLKTGIRPSRRRGALSKRISVIREVIREVAGYAPYEKRIMELLRLSRDRRALRFAKRRLGTHRRAIRKREELHGVLQKT